MVEKLDSILDYHPPSDGLTQPKWLLYHSKTGKAMARKKMAESTSTNIKKAIHPPWIPPGFVNIEYHKHVLKTDNSLSVNMKEEHIPHIDVNGTYTIQQEKSKK